MRLEVLQIYTKIIMARIKDKLVQVEIKGFKSISTKKPLVLDFCDVTILLGANGSGKSNVISFFRMMNFMMTGALQRFVAQSGTNQNFLHYGSKITPFLSGKVKFKKGNAYETYSFELTQASGEKLIITSEEVSWQKEGKSKPYSVQVESDYKESGLIDNEGQTEKIIRTLLSRCKAYQFHDSSSTGPLRQASRINTAQYLQSEGNNLASFLYFLKNNFEKEYKRIVSYIKMILPHFGDFYLEPENDYVRLNWTDDSGNDYVFSPDQFSDGSIRFIALATLLLQPEKTMPGMIIIDEPELGLHPYAIEQLTQMVKDASVHSQVIIATQSPQLIDGFSLDSIVVLEQDNETRSTIAHRLDKEQLTEWIDEYTVSELWRKNVIGGQPL